MPVVYRLGDIFVLPSIGPGETWGLAVNEAMACKRPAVVSTKCGCAPDLVTEKNTGWVFEPGLAGEQKIKNEMEDLLNAPSVLDSMGEQAQHAIQSYSYTKDVECIRGLMKKIENSQIKSNS
jgi:glycosyltransferase involved in cell wall biosynthesis